MFGAGDTAGDWGEDGAGAEGAVEGCGDGGGGVRGEGGVGWQLRSRVFLMEWAVFGIAVEKQVMGSGRWEGNVRRVWFEMHVLCSR